MTLPPRTAYAQQFVCSRIDPGDSAASLALRMTGDAANRFAPWFQILDPITQRFVPKSQYGVLLARWRACLSAQLPGTAVSRVQSPASAAASRPRPGILQAAAFDVGFASRVGVGVWLLLLSLLLMDGYLAATRPVPDNLRRAGDEFVQAFARPLFQHPSDVPIKARLRFVPDLQRLEILIAPSAGRRYPNLSDHRRNFEYDVQHVLQSLDDELVVCDGFRSEGQWVVIPVTRKHEIARKHESTRKHEKPKNTEGVK